MIPLVTRHSFVPSPQRGQRSCYLGNSVGDKWTTEGGFTMGKWRDTVDALFGLTRVGEGSGVNDLTRASIAGRVAGNAVLQTGTVQPINAQNNVVGCCLSYLAEVIFLELGTNDWYYTTNAYTPAVFGASLDAIFAALMANVPVKSVQAIVPTAALGGNYTLLYAVSTTASILATDTILTINGKLQGASGGAIPFVASTLGADPPLSNGYPLILTANVAGANAQIVIGTNAVTGGSISRQGSLGGTPAVKQIVVVGMGNHATDAPAGGGASGFSAGGFPSWATSLADCYWQLEMMLRAKAAAWNGNNGIPISYAKISDMPQSYTVDHTHPLDPVGQTFYSDRIIRALTMAE